MAATLTPTQVAIIKSTVPILAAHGETITAQFYGTLLSTHTELRNIFNNTHQATGHQARALAGALYAYAANIDNLGALAPAVELICHKHTSLYIQPEHYETVGTGLLAAMKKVLGDAATDEIMDAWGAAYWQLANIMIQREKALYEKTNGWTDWKDFKIAKKEVESADITSFYLQPVEKKMVLPEFKPGQYISVNVFVDELHGGVWQARQYSLSDAPGKSYYRISVKREPELDMGSDKAKTHPGYISNILHDKKNVGDVVRLSHPFGDFFFEEEKEGEAGPVVLISAGVGLTCLLSILNTLTGRHSERPISWIHGARDFRVRAFKSHIDSLVGNKTNLRSVTFASAPSEKEVQGADYDILGRLSLEKVNREDLFLDSSKTQYFICGPTQFMLQTDEVLKGYGIPSEHVKMELFGTGGVPRV